MKILPLFTIREANLSRRLDMCSKNSCTFAYSETHLKVVQSTELHGQRNNLGYRSTRQETWTEKSSCDGLFHSFLQASSWLLWLLYEVYVQGNIWLTHFSREQFLEVTILWPTNHWGSFWRKHCPWTEFSQWYTVTLSLDGIQPVIHCDFFSFKN